MIRLCSENNNDHEFIFKQATMNKKQVSAPGASRNVHGKPRSGLPGRRNGPRSAKHEKTAKNNIILFYPGSKYF